MQIVPALVPEESSCKVTASFLDPEDDSAITPDSNILWTLRDLEGNVINSRNQVSVAPASSVEIFLSGDDLAMTDQTKAIEKREIIIETTYDPGSGSINLKDSAQFAISNLNGIT